MLPRVHPIAPVRRTEPFDDAEWLFDLKYDGFRALCYFEEGRCRLISRNGNPMTRRRSHAAVGNVLEAGSRA
jgi:bifunctional non-homologous end joining protein LigD